jgi:hypothetical protein
MYESIFWTWKLLLAFMKNVLNEILIIKKLNFYQQFYSFLNKNCVFNSVKRW